MTQPDLETLSDFIASPGWTWFSEHVTREWGPSGLRYQQAVRDAAKDANAVVELQKVLHTQEAVLSLMRYPIEKAQTERARKLAELQAKVGGGVSRRGPGL